jgi:hypothetical protein
VVDTYVEVPFKSANKPCRPDGLIRVQHGSKPPWVALVEVKTGDANLSAEQINEYWEIAREHGFDAVITVSNDLAPAEGVHPVDGLRVRANSKVKVHHWSWFSILTAASVERDHRGVDDPEQSWILNELIRYLEHPNSGAGKFGDMGESWTAVRDAARDGTLSKRTPGVDDFVSRWDQLMRYLSLRLSSETGATVHPVLSKAHRDNSSKRTADLIESLSTSGTVGGTLRIPNTAADLNIVADLRGQRLTTWVEIEAPKDRGGKARVTWLLRQLSDASDGLVIESWVKNGRHASAVAPLGALRADGTALAPEGSGDVAKFRITAISDMGRNRRGGGRAPSFVEAAEAAVFAMYGAVLQGLRQWSAPAPRLDRPPSPSVAAETPIDTETIVSADPARDSDASEAEAPPPIAAPHWWVPEARAQEPATATEGNE